MTWILVAEDDGFSRRYLEAILTAAGWQVEAHADGASACLLEARSRLGAGQQVAAQGVYGPRPNARHNRQHRCDAISG